MEVAPEGLLHLFGLALAQQPVVDEHAHQLVADRLVHQRGGDRRVDPTGETADDRVGADRGPNGLDRLLDDADVRPERPSVTCLIEEVLEHLLPPRGVGNLGVELHAVDPAFRFSIAATGESAVAAVTTKPFRRFRHRIPMAHPDRLQFGSS